MDKQSEKEIDASDMPESKTGAAEKVVSADRKEVLNPDNQPKDAQTKEGPTLLDLAFALDCTGSMGSYIQQAQQNIRCIVEEIVSQEKADVRMALVEYRDHPPQDSTFVTRVNDFVNSVRTMKSWLDASHASGGGDQPEAVADALHQLLKLSWRPEATKIAVFIADAPPHGLGCGGDGFANGCPDGLDPMQITNQLAEKGVTLYMVGCEPSIVPYKDFFMSLAHLTGGQYVPLGSAALLTPVITGGAQEEISLQRLMEDVNREVLQEVNDAGDQPLEQEALSKKVHLKMQSKGIMSKHLYRNAAEVSKPTARAQIMSDCTTMADVRNKCPPEADVRAQSLSAARKASKTAPHKSGGGFINRLFGSSKGEKESAESAEAYEEVDGHCAAMAPPIMSSASDHYSCPQEEISEAQVQRMVQRSVVTNALKSKVVKSYKY